MKAVILAAGMGKRLAQYTAEQTKCMVKVCGVSLIERLLNQICKYDVDEIVIVTGYKSSTLIDYVDGIVSKYNIDIPVKYIDNKDYAVTNNIYSLYLARNELLENDVVLFESDLIFDDEIINQVFTSEHKNFALVAPYREWMDGTVITIDNENNITSFIPKENFNYEDKNKYFKTANIYRLSKEFSSQEYVPFLEAYIKSKGLNEYYEQVLSVIISMGSKSCKAEVIKKGSWYEIDDANDLHIAESMFAQDDSKLDSYFKRYGGYWRFDNLLDFCYLVNPYFPPKKMVDEFKNSFERLLINYPSGMNVNRSLASTMFNVKQDYITVGNGAAELIRELMRNYNEKTGIIFPSFEEYANSMQKESIAAMNINDDFSYNADMIISFMKRNNLKRMVIIAPDNPSGYLISYDEIIKVLDYTSQNNILIIFDESFIDFADDAHRYTLISNSILEKYNNLIVMKSISKSYGVPGLRLGVMASGNIEIVKKVSSACSIWNINSFGEFFMQIIGKYSKDYKTACDKIAVVRERMQEGLKAIDGIKVYQSQANYILCKVEKPNYDIHSVMTCLLSKDLLIKDCSSKKGFDGGVYIRLAVRTEEENNLLINELKNYF